VIPLVPGTRPRRVLAVGAHPDDVEIGCGGTLLTLARDVPEVEVDVLVVTGTPERAAEAERGAELFAGKSLGAVSVAGLPDGRLPSVWGRVKALLEDVAHRGRYDLLLSPRHDDAHQDHRLVAEVVATVWRDHLVLGYEVPKYDGDLHPAPVHVAIDEDTLTRKCELLHKAFPSQAARAWFDDEVFRGLARLRGVECRSRYAEAFTCSTVRLSW
jgi:LmbE family N-acetylglucosaminyl deacetylase